MSTKAFAYLRVSGKGQLDGDGFTRQREAIEHYAAQHDIEIVAFFEEKGVPGATEWDDRPAWVEMIGRLNGVRTIVIERLDRLARELFVQEHILRELKHRGIELFTAAGEECGDEDPTRVLFRQILGAIAQFDKTMIVRKMRHARENQRETCQNCQALRKACQCGAFQAGRCEGRKPYGHREGEAYWIEIMKRYRLQGATFDWIATYLNDEGVSTRVPGTKWYGCTVKRILRKLDSNI